MTRPTTTTPLIKGPAGMSKPGDLPSWVLPALAVVIVVAVVWFSLIRRK